jgi:hypothetical protein
MIQFANKGFYFNPLPQKNMKFNVEGCIERRKMFESLLFLGTTKKHIFC